MIGYAVAVNWAAGELYIRKLDYSDIWSDTNPYGWTYQGVFGPHADVVFECDTREEADAMADKIEKEYFS